MLHEQVAIISGGLGDIGIAIAERLGVMGARISIGDVMEEQDIRVAKGLERLKQKQIHAIYTKADVTSEADIHFWLERTVQEIGIPNLVIPNAGIVTIRSGLEISMAQLKKEFDVNVFGAFCLAQMCAQRLKQHRLPGKIVYIGSWAGHRHHIETAAYCATKAASRSLFQTLAKELASDHILVNEVAPGAVDAGLVKKIFHDNPGLREESIRKIPVENFIQAEEIAWHVGNLCHPENRNMTGSVVLVDGGLSLTDKYSD